MKKLMSIPMIGLFLLAGCVATEVDQEYGKASMSSWDMQIVDPAPAAAEQTPDGLAGIDAEEVMGAHNRTFGEEQTDIGSLTIDTSVGGN